MIFPVAKKLSKTQLQRIELRNSLWADLREDDLDLWDYKKSDGWLNIPRAMPLLLRIMDVLSKGKPVSSVYLDLWCRTFNDSFVVASNPREMAFFSGFSGERAERTWMDRINILKTQGFIDTREGPTGPNNYILILNPYKIIRSLHAEDRVNNRYYNAMLSRMVEIRATDLAIVNKTYEGEPANLTDAANLINLVNASNLPPDNTKQKRRHRRNIRGATKDDT